jgi:hypothetical protein
MGAQRGWVYSPKEAARPKVPERLKVEVQSRAQTLIDEVLKPMHIKPPGKDEQWNYLVDIFCKWRGSFFYFCSTYHCPGPNAITPSFESRFARLEYIGNNTFALAYMRYTGQWWEVFPELTLEQALETIGRGEIFSP